MIDPRSDPFVTGWNAVSVARIASVMAFLEEDRGRMSGVALDVGGDSPQAKKIREAFSGIALVQTGDIEGHDLDFDPIPGQYLNVFSMEVIEHLGNPLRHLCQLRDALMPGGRIYLSTVLVVNKFRPTHFLRSKHHLFEMDWDQLEFLIDRAGLVVEKTKTHRYLETWKYFTGLRPIVRFFTDRGIVMRLRRKEEHK